MNARAKWNRKHSGPPGDPDPFLVGALDYLRPGSVLDLACGTGRNSLFLAERGFEVTGVDISDVGLRRMRRAAQRGLSVKAMEADLENGSAPWAAFDNVLVINYLPTPELWASIHAMVKPLGAFLFCTFHNARPGHMNPAYALEKGALRAGLPHFTLLSYHGGPSRDGYIFRRDAKAAS